ncbi:transposase [Mycobacterium sp.]|uniref:transposase n=1 Tax=Mycobacterium sp. TaxID=1785 RepID=UPI003F9BCF13
MRAAGIYRCQDRDDAAARLYHWTVYCIDSGVAEIARLARAITTWREEFLAFLSAGRVSNGPTEAVNLLIKKTSVSVTDSETNYRLRPLLHAGRS